MLPELILLILVEDLGHRSHQVRASAQCRLTNLVNRYELGQELKRIKHKDPEVNKRLGIVLSQHENIWPEVGWRIPYIVWFPDHADYWQELHLVEHRRGKHHDPSMPHDDWHKKEGMEGTFAYLELLFQKGCTRAEVIKLVREAISIEDRQALTAPIFTSH